MIDNRDTKRGTEPRDDVPKPALFVRRVRLRLGATQAQFAQAAGVPKGSVSNVEGGYSAGVRVGRRWKAVLDFARRVARPEAAELRERLREACVAERLARKVRSLGRTG